MEPILQSIFDSAVEGIIVIDAKGLIKAFNPAAERLFGYRAEEVIGQNVKMLMPSPDHEQHDRLPRALPGNRHPHDHRHGPRGSRTPQRRQHVSPSPVGRSHGDRRPAGVHRHPPRPDPQSRNQDALRKSEERVRSIVESAVDGIVVIDERGTIQAFNPSAERLFGYGLSEVLGRNISMLMPSPDRERHDGYMRHYLETGEQKIIGIGREVTGLRKNGTTFPVHLSVGEMIDGWAPKLHGHPSRPERSRLSSSSGWPSRNRSRSSVRWLPSSRTR